MRAQEAVKFENIAATTSAFVLNGGRYQFAVTATFGGGSVGIEMLGPNGSSWLLVATALTAAGVVTYELPPGQYRVVIATATAVYVTIVRVPGE